MTGKQTAVMWLGLLLIIARLFSTGQWSEIWGTVDSKSSATQPNNTSPASGSPSAPGSPAQPPLLSPTGGKPL